MLMGFVQVEDSEADVSGPEDSEAENSEAEDMEDSHSDLERFLDGCDMKSADAEESDAEDSDAEDSNAEESGGRKACWGIVLPEGRQDRPVARNRVPIPECDHCMWA